MDTTEHDLKLLSIGYFVQGGIITFYSLLCLCYVGFMGAILSFAANQPQTKDQVPAGVIALIGGIFTGIVVLMVLAGVCTLYAGFAVRRRRHRVFVLIVAALGCLAIPYGTVLGVFTFMVLQRPVAKAMFGEVPLPQPL